MKDSKSSPHSDVQAPNHPNTPSNSKTLRRRYSDFFEFAPVGYFTFDRDGVILKANPTGALLLGTDHNRLLNKPFSQFISPESEKVFELHSRLIFNTGTL